MEGFLNIAKPAGCTSRDVVNRVQALVRPLKAGHAGTLDPIASGVLVVAIGQGTRLIQFVQESAKAYRGRFLLGRTSPTEDIEGEVVELTDAPIPTLDDLQVACPQFEGEIEQTPPQFSALKVNGKRAYQLARKGAKAELRPRRVRVDRCRVAHFDYPTMELEIDCGSGVYVRSLGRDLARAVGSDAVMSALVRTAVGAFSLRDALPAEEISQANIQTYLKPLLSAVADLPRAEMTDDELAVVANGGFLPNRLGDCPHPSGLFAGLNGEGRLSVLLRVDSRDQLRPVKNFPLAGA